MLRVKEVELEANLVSEECPIQIFDKQVNKLINKHISLEKVL